jgi:hypothetical protein
MPAFETMYYRARRIGMEAMSDATVLIADDDTLDILPDGSPNPTAVNRARLMVHARHFLMGKLDRKTYGDKVQHEHSGEVQHTIDLSDRERMRLLASFLDEDRRGVTIDGQATTLPALPSLPALPDLNDDGLQAIDEPRARDDTI